MVKRKPIEQILVDAGGIQLDIGCGAHKQPGYVGMDIQALPGVDIVHDFEKYPWPLPDECCIRVIASHVVEHVNPVKFGFIKFMDEIWRVLKYDGQLAISTPYATSKGYFQDPTHVNPCNEVTWAYFDPLEPNTQGLLYKFYKPKPWKLIHLSWDPTANIEVLMNKRREDRSYYA